MKVINPESLGEPKGYANGIAADGPLLAVGGQIGWRDGVVADGFVEQFALALDNVLEVVKSAGAKPIDIISMTVFVTDLDAYRQSQKALGKVWRERLGKHFPAMALLGVAGLVEPKAQVEIQAWVTLEESREQS